MSLTTPTPQQAQWFARTVDSTEALIATIMSPSAGARPMHLTSIEMVDRFLEAHTIEDFQAVGLRLDIHFVDFGFLSEWIDEVIGDSDLAAAVRATSETGEAFGVLVPRVKAVLRERLDQFEESLGTLEPSSEERTNQ